MIVVGARKTSMAPPLSSEPRPSSVDYGWDLRKRRGSSVVLLLPSRATVTEHPDPPDYNEPVVLWRMRRGDSLHSHAVIGPKSNRALIVWFVNGTPLGFRDFGDWTSALRWSDQLQAQNWAVGWRVAPD
jgi:hypothetical protein